MAHQNLANGQQILRGLLLEQTAGTATGLDVAQQDTAVALLNVAIPPLEEQFRQTVYALAVLIGKTPESIDVNSGTLTDLVLTALGNVESALVAARQTEDQYQRQRDAVAKARRAYEFAQAQMSAGTVNVLTVLNTENALFSAQDSPVQAVAKLHGSARSSCSTGIRDCALCWCSPAHCTHRREVLPRPRLRPPPHRRPRRPSDR